jgi:arylsulfatase A-like enzyme
VPLVLSGPGVPAGETRDALCYQCDLNPTLRDLADLPVPADLDAESLAPVLGDADADHRDAVVAAYRDCQRMVRGERYKLVEYAGEADRTTQLFDLAADPAETASLADDPAHRERRDRLRQRLVAETAALGGSVPDAFLD